MNRIALALLLFSPLYLTACDNPPQETQQKEAAAPAAAEEISAPSTPSSPAPEAAVVTHEWAGQWNGPEGTYLKIEPGPGMLKLTIADLDGPKEFSGMPDGDRIRFERNGQVEYIRAATGAETGMKWLAEKRYCLMVKEGEGYCRG